MTPEQMIVITQLLGQYAITRIDSDPDKIDLWRLFPDNGSEVWITLEGDQYWYEGNAASRCDGPAVVFFDKKWDDEWWLDGVQMSESEFFIYRQPGHRPSVD